MPPLFSRTQIYAFIFQLFSKNYELPTSCTVVSSAAQSTMFKSNILKSSLKFIKNSVRKSPELIKQKRIACKPKTNKKKKSKPLFSLSFLHHQGVVSCLNLPQARGGAWKGSADENTESPGHTVDCEKKGYREKIPAEGTRTFAEEPSRVKKATQLAGKNGGKGRKNEDTCFS